MPGSIYQPDGGEAARRPPRRLALLSPPPPAAQEPPPAEPEPEREREAPPQDEAAALRFALDQLSLLGLEEAAEAAEAALAEPEPGGLLEGGGSPPAAGAASPPAAFGTFAPHLGAPAALLAEHMSLLGGRKKSVNMTECVPVPSSEHVAEIVGRQGCKIKALRAKTNTYIKTPVRGEEPVFIVTGRKEDVEMAKREILSAAEHFSMIRATRNKVNGLAGAMQGPPNLPGQTTIQVRVPYRVVGLVVGPKGATIKRIQQQTHTYIVTPSRDKEPVFEVTGMPENVDRAREEIEAHITMRTGSFIDVNADNDFHSNGTDVCLELQGGAAGPWAKAPHAAARRLRHDALSSLGGASAEPFYGGRAADASPTSPYGAGGFAFSEPQAPLASDERDFAFDFLALDLSAPAAAIWSPFERSGHPLQALGGRSGGGGGGGSRRRRDSGPCTPRHSPPPPPEEQPAARRAQSEPVGASPWLPAPGSLSSFSTSTGYSSSSSLPGSVSAASGSPTDSSGSEGPRRSSRECMVCFESEVMAALVPCGHNLFCMECAARICGRAEPQCPACRAPATQAIHIFS
ncbi:RNA-binding protein MEX3D [Rhea pennata]|uniref:RNA-binding protein MEX3D n=1 Tax=Rhea pennata TaxID=8795 RepID=UPI002E2523EF